MNLKNILIGAFIGITALNASGQELIRPVITGAPFLQIVPDARAGGMGEAGVSTAPDAYSQFHNPAKFPQGISLSYIPQFVGYADDIFYANLGFYKKLSDRAAFSSSLTYFNFGSVEMEEEVGDQIVSLGRFKPNEFALDATYSLKLDEFFGMAVTARYVRSDITNGETNAGVEFKTGQAVSADISGYYISEPMDQHINRWTLGFNLKNVGSKLKYSNETGFDYALPTSLKFGGGYHIAASTKDYISFHAEALKYLVPASDDNRNIPNSSAIGGIFESFTDAPDGFSEEMKEVIYSLGAELNFNEIFSVRTGFVTQNRDKGFRNHVTFGAGLIWNNFLFDFAYQSPVSNYITFHQDKVVKLSISFKFDSPKRATIVAPELAPE